jgi:hypothetical protein
MAADMTKNKYLPIHTNELHGPKFHNQAIPKKIGQYTICLPALIVNLIFLWEVRWCINNTLFQKSTSGFES